MTAIFGIIFFTFLLIMGVHAVTRPDKLLSFLGVYIKEEHEAANMNKYIEPDLINLQESFFEDLDAIAFFDKLSRLKLLDDYNEARKTLSSHDERLKQLSLAIKKKKARKSWIAISKFAPMLTECVTCMSSFWSLLVVLMHFSGLFYIEFLSVPFIALFVPFVVAGVVEVISRLTSDFNEITEAINSLNNE